MNVYTLVGIAVASVLVLSIIFRVAFRKRRPCLTLEELPRAIYHIDHEAAAKIADLWQRDRENIRITRAQVLEAVGGSDGFKNMRRNVDCIMQVLPDHMSAAEQDPELAELTLAVYNGCRSLRFYLQVAVVEDKMLSKNDLVRPFHCAEALWKYQQVVDLFYELIASTKNPQVVEGLEFVL
jgi:hypothetical protein